MSAIIRNQWQIYFHPLFAQQWGELVQEVKRLKEKLDLDVFIRHPKAKLLKAIDQGIKVTIPQDPLASYFALQGSLRPFCRLKKLGLPARYRLFFRVFPEQKTIIILWLGFPRKQGDKKDCYAVFEKLVRQGEFPQTMTEFLGYINKN
ncbi:type II toxin-antitoxin system YhaV family toxin [Synechocystis sp. PCC 7339]|uniref:type II toxin-antitoxin system YhaV family toxin n=1 Tax=unclassified Synechocystis TaxID=2640012 RepID=UPI001BB03C92|nr:MULTISPECIES: type II toxin-antitoxin system YhaV family toxin [unclassified Synechocystis]QUS61836.1 type II toxin-antitoxin system YhaV family toxin [Synechocystis sp. PCC 7338]UAJ74033.1 type II toxin-antitoxin system YhaV family toxin [Synechocystis sp. PCC 7339]